MLPECSVDEVNLFSIPHHYADRVGGVQSILLSVCCSRDLACLGVGSADDGICFCAIGNKNAGTSQQKCQPRASIYRKICTFCNLLLRTGTGKYYDK